MAAESHFDVEWRFEEGGAEGAWAFFNGPYADLGQAHKVARRAFRGSEGIETRVVEVTVTRTVIPADDGVAS